VDAVENYRRDLDLATATAHVSFTTGGVTFSREVFVSAPDQVIVVRLTASRPGQISFQARMQTPQRATVEATAGGDLVMRGTNGDGPGNTADGRPMTGALRFEARVRVVTSGGTRSASGDAMAVRGADAVTLLISAATSYRTYEDVGADPDRRLQRHVILQRDVILHEHDLLARCQAAQALVSRGGRQPGSHPRRVFEAVNVLEQAQPRDLGDVIGVALHQLEVACHRPDEPLVLVDQALPCPPVPFGGALHQQGDVRGAGVPFRYRSDRVA